MANSNENLPGIETESVPEIKVEEITGNDLEGDFATGMPGVNEAAVNAHKERENIEKKAEETAKVSAPAFDSAIHAVDANGQPKRNKDGSLQLKRGRKAGTVTAPNSSTKPALNLPTKPDASEAAPNANGQRDLAIITTQSLDGLLIATLSDEMAPSPEEFNMTVNAWERLYREKGVEDLPPWAALTVIYVSRVIARSDKPKVKKRLGLGAKIIGRLTGSEKGGFWSRVADWFRGDDYEAETLADSKEKKE